MANVNTNTTTTTQDPWSVQQPYLGFGYERAKDLYNTQKGAPYPGMGANSIEGLNSTINTARQPNPFLAGGTNTLNTIGSGAAGINTGGMFDQIYRQVENRGRAGPEGMLNVYAQAGKPGEANPMFKNIYGDFRAPGFLSQGMFGDVSEGGMVGSNKYREAALQDALNEAENRINANMQATGRFGSGHYGEGMSRGLGGIAANARMQGYDTDLQAMMQGAQARAQEGLGRGQLALGAAGNLSADALNRLQTQLGAAQAYSGDMLAKHGLRLSAAQGKTGVESQNIANRLGATGMFPGFNQMRYADSDRMIGAGSAIDQDALNRMQAPWNLLNQGMGVWNSGPGGGTRTTTEMEPAASPLLRSIAGAAGGAQIGGMFNNPWGSIIGGGIGAMGGMFA